MHPAQKIDPAREAARNARRAAVLEHAEQVFAERGFTGATMVEIAARTGYSAGNLYNVFENKEALFKEVMTSRGRLFMERLVGALSDAGSFVELLDGYVDAVLGFVEEQRNFFLILTQLTGTLEWGSGVWSKEASEIRGPIEHATLQLFERAVANFEIPAGEPRVYTSIVMGALSAYAARWIRDEDKPEDLWRHAEQLRDVLHRALGVEA